MLTHDVSKIPIRRRTPSRMSLIMSGGIRSDRISNKASGFIFPTANLASLTKGLKHENTLKREMSIWETQHFPFQFSHNFLFFLNTSLRMKLTLMQIHVYKLLKNCHVLTKW